MAYTAQRDADKYSLAQLNAKTNAHQSQIETKVAKRTSLQPAESSPTEASASQPSPENQQHDDAEAGEAKLQAEFPTPHQATSIPEVTSTQSSPSDDGADDSQPRSTFKGQKPNTYDVLAEMNAEPLADWSKDPGLPPVPPPEEPRAKLEVRAPLGYSKEFKAMFSTPVLAKLLIDVFSPNTAFANNAKEKVIELWKDNGSPLCMRQLTEDDACRGHHAEALCNIELALKALEHRKEKQANADEKQRKAANKRGGKAGPDKDGFTDPNQRKRETASQQGKGGDQFARSKGGSGSGGGRKGQEGRCHKCHTQHPPAQACRAKPDFPRQLCEFCSKSHAGRCAWCHECQCVHNDRMVCLPGMGVGNEKHRASRAPIQRSSAPRLQEPTAGHSRNHPREDHPVVIGYTAGLQNMMRDAAPPPAQTRQYSSAASLDNGQVPARGSGSRRPGPMTRAAPADAGRQQPPTKATERQPPTPPTRFAEQELPSRATESQPPAPPTTTGSAATRPQQSPAPTLYQQVTFQRFHDANAMTQTEEGALFNRRMAAVTLERPDAPSQPTLLRQLLAQDRDLYQMLDDSYPDLIAWMAQARAVWPQPRQQRQQQHQQTQQVQQAQQQQQQQVQQVQQAQQPVAVLPAAPAQQAQQTQQPVAPLQQAAGQEMVAEVARAFTEFMLTKMNGGQGQGGTR